jgi:hypothetical protein
MSSERFKELARELVSAIVTDFCDEEGLTSEPGSGKQGADLMEPPMEQPYEYPPGLLPPTGACRRVQQAVVYRARFWRRSDRESVHRVRARRR